MLQALSIRDFVIVESLDLEFDKGYTALTGETGAGKSILIDALSLSLGARNEGAVIRVGCDKAEISTTFWVKDNQNVQQWFVDNEIDAEDELILRRVIHQDGRSRAFINGVASTVTQLKSIGEQLIDIYSQNAHHSLLKTGAQRDILDSYADAKSLAQKVAEQYQIWQRLHQQRIDVEQHAEAHANELAELRDQIRELERLGFDADSWSALQEEHHRLANGAGLLSGLEQCLALLEDNEPNANAMLSQVQLKLTELHEIDPAIKEAVDGVDSAVIQLEEASRFLSRYLQSTDLDPARLSEIENQIQDTHQTARKYRVTPEELATLLETSAARMAELETFTNDGELAKQEQAALGDYQQSAKELSAKRQKAADVLSKKITAEMQRLSLSGGQFQIELQARDASLSGLETVHFLVAGHAGVAPAPLNKVASGGELSRISLALHVTTASLASVPCMIFDEVDVGIGGGVAEVVGALLDQLGKNRQVLVITHLPQVASLAQQHLQVSKTQNNGVTLSHIQQLTDVERVEEIARMSGGLEITDATRAHAREMLLK